MTRYEYEGGSMFVKTNQVSFASYDFFKCKNDIVWDCHDTL